MTYPLVSVIIPCLNEKKTIEQVLTAFLQQTYPIDRMEVIVADAMSSDGTRDIIANFSINHPEMGIHVIDNKARSIPSGLNQAILSSHGEIITRMDAHSIPATDYVEKSVLALQSGLGENIGGVIDVTPGNESWISQSIAYAAAHPIGVGDAFYRWSSKPTYADTVAFGTFKRALVDKIGLFDESLKANEDYEFNTRIRSSGGRVFVDPGIRAKYFSRTDLRSLARQYFSYGFWKLRMLLRFPKTLRWRQALPPLFVLGNLVLFLAGFFWKITWLGWATILGLYSFILLMSAIPIAIRQKKPMLALGIPLAIMTMHFSWGTGFLISLFSTIIRGSLHGN